MANDNHLLSVPCYNETMQKQDYYNEFFELGQQKINFSFFELSLPDDDPVYTLKKVMEDLDFPGLLANCSDKKCLCMIRCFQISLTNFPESPVITCFC